MTTGKPADKKLVQQFANSELQKQIVTIDSWMAEMKEQDLQFTPQDVANFIAFWETMKSDDAKVKVAHHITHNFLKTDANGIASDCIANMFYNGDGVYNKPFADFMERMTRLADVS